MQKVFMSYSDPDHGWVKVPLSLIRTLCIGHAISSCSYVHNSFAYLEEDADLNVFHSAMLARGITPIYKGKTANKQSKIRGYARYPAPILIQKGTDNGT